MKVARILAFSTVISIAASGQCLAANTLIQNKGSDTLVNVAQAWAEKYPTINPDISVAISGGGSGTGYGGND